MSSPFSLWNTLKCVNGIWYITTSKGQQQKVEQTIAEIVGQQAGFNAFLANLNLPVPIDPSSLTGSKVFKKAFHQKNQIFANQLPELLDRFLSSYVPVEDVKLFTASVDDDDDKEDFKITLNLQAKTPALTAQALAAQAASSPVKIEDVLATANREALLLQQQRDSAEAETKRLEQKRLKVLQEKEAAQEKKRAKALQAELERKQAEVEAENLLKRRIGDIYEPLNRIFTSKQLTSFAKCSHKDELMRAFLRAVLYNFSDDAERPKMVEEVKMNTKGLDTPDYRDDLRALFLATFRETNSRAVVLTGNSQADDLETLWITFLPQYLKSADELGDYFAVCVQVNSASSGTITIDRVKNLTGYKNAFSTGFHAIFGRKTAYQRRHN
jgi:hypothetical protein